MQVTNAVSSWTTPKYSKHWFQPQTSDEEMKKTPVRVDSESAVISNAISQSIAHTVGTLDGTSIGCHGSAPPRE